MRDKDVTFTLPPFEAGMLLGVLAYQLGRESKVDEPGDPLRREAINSAWRTLTAQMRDWQKGRGDV